MAKRFDVVGTGYVPCNKRRFQGEIVLYRPCYGIVSVKCNDKMLIGMSRDEYDPAVGMRVDAFMEVKTYTKGCEHYDTEKNGRMCYGGIRFDCDLFMEVTFAKRGYTGDIRDLLPRALKEIKWPTDPKRYFLIQTNGEFWDRPLPMGVRPRKVRA